MLKIDDIAPKFCLKDQNGAKVCLEDFFEKWVILYFYPKDDTPSCTKEACDFTAKLPHFNSLNAVILGISNDDEKSHQDFIKKFKLNLILLCDTNTKVSQEYGVWKLVNKNGTDMMRIVRATFIINPKGRIAKTWYEVNVDGHVDEVEEFLKG